jgi:D-beta-D-heptose 7-phosphate kinase/D-beta-D-heptose 1-phosphate adenosyltransferase
VIGNDFIGSKIKELLDEHHIQHHLYIDSQRKTTQKNRIFHKETIVTRYDIEDTHCISVDIESEIIHYITNQEKPDLLLFSDYAKGVLSPTLCETLIDYANRNNILTFVDPKPSGAIKYQNCFCMKVNLLEGATIADQPLDSLCKKEILEKVKSYIGCKHVILTCAGDGMYVDTIDNHIFHKKKINVKDVTGCGDTVLSVLSYMYPQNANMLESAKIANYIAGKCVETIGNYSFTKEDICDYVDCVVYDTEKEKIQCIRNTNKNIVFTNGCFDLIHSAHIKLLQFSKKQGNILVVGLNSDESIKRLKGEKRPIHSLEERCELLKHLGFIDYIIIFNEDTPLHILKELRPDIIVKGGDYTKESIIGKEYAKEVVLFDYMNGISSTNTIQKVISL